MGERVHVAAKKPELKRENPASHTRNADRSQSMSSPVEHVLFLQRTIGNQAVQRLIKSGALQAKLRIGQPGDIYEQKADRVADEVMRMPEPKSVSGGEPHIQRACPGCEEEELRRQPIEEEEELQAKAASGDISEVNPNLTSHIHSLKGGGQPLSENDRTFFEPRFGRDFSQVRVHTDAKAAEAVNARAFTVGHDVVFGMGQYTPGTLEGRRLLAHELTHSIQQSQLGKVSISKDNSIKLPLKSPMAFVMRSQQTIGSSSVGRLLSKQTGFRCISLTSIKQSPNSGVTLIQRISEETERTIAEGIELRGQLSFMGSEVLVTLARQLDSELSNATPQAQAENAHTLLAIQAELQQRIDQAPLVDLVPQVAGLSWYPDDPLVGLLEAIAPFHNYEYWQQMTSRGDPFHYAATVTSGFESRGSYSAYQNRDIGGISYGAYQFTQTSGNLFQVLHRWVNHPLSAAEVPSARTVIERIISIGASHFRTDTALRSNFAFEQALRQAGRTSSMEQVQDRFARETMFTPASNLARESGVHSRIGQAIFSDTRNASPRMLQRIVNTLENTPAYAIGEREYLHRFLNLRERYTLSSADAQERLATAERIGGNTARAEQLEANAQALRRSPERRLQLLHQLIDREFPR